MGVLKGLRCPKCGWESPSTTSFQCPSCAVVLEAQFLLARFAGIFAEPAAATSVAAAWRLRKQGVISQDDLVVCTITGHGLKQPSAIQIRAEDLRPIAPDLNALRKHLEGRLG